MVIIRIVCIALILIGVLIMIIKDALIKKNNNQPSKRDDEHNFCILIPARDESNVIEGLLKSIKNQAYNINMKDVYVIVEDAKDKTVAICEKYNASVIVRKHLELKRKGYALDEAVKEILSEKKHYDAYFIFDADNILDKNFMKNMLPVFDKGYDFASGYRNSKNGNASVIAAASSLTFSLVNTLFNKRKIRETRNITFSGTGFYIRGYIIDELKGYPFHSLTEDYELSMYSAIKNYTTYYNETSIFYDEQPVKYKQTVTQRIRWIRGFFDVRRKYAKDLRKSFKLNDPNYGSKIDELIGISPYILIVVGYILWLIASITNMIINKYVLETILLIISGYFILLLFTLGLLIIEKKMLDINTKMKIKTLFFNPIFLITYVPCAIKALLKKEVTWDKITHGN